MNNPGVRVGSALLVAVSAAVPVRRVLKRAVQRVLGELPRRVRALILVGAHCT